MTAWAGIFFLALATCAASVAAAAAYRDAWRRKETAVPRSAALLCLVATAGTVLTVEWALLHHDFSVRFVAENGSRSTPVFYTVTSLWAAHDGSLLLWDLVLAVFLTWTSLRRVSPVHDAWATAVVATVAVFFIALTQVTTDVFDRVTPAPEDGPGPLPLLQDHPAMGIHPPLLYLGLAGLVVPFGYAAAALVTGETGPAWARIVAVPVRVAWTALTAGIVLGAWWSYSVLGWGGYWSWDPVENSSLMPWLLATALVHTLAVQRRRGALPGTGLALALAAFVLAAGGVVLTRSGIAASVHTFADSGLGPVLLGFMLALLAAGVGLALARARSWTAGPQVGPAGSRSAWLAGGAALLAVLASVILLGTLVPVLADVAGGDEVSVGAPWFDRVASPLALTVLASMLVARTLRWGRTDVGTLFNRLTPPIAAGNLTVALVAWQGSGSLAAPVAVGLAAAVVLGVVVETAPEARAAWIGSAPGRLHRTTRWARRARPQLGGRVAHAGLAVLLAGVALSSTYSHTGERQLRVGEAMDVGGWHATLMRVDRRADGHLMRTGADLSLQHGDLAARLQPELHFYPARGATVAAPAVRSRPTGDVYATVLAVDQAGGSATVRLAVNPFVSLIWGGGALVVVGSLIGWRRFRTRVDRPAARVLVGAGEGV